MYQAATGTDLVQSDVFMQYRTDLAQSIRPSLPAVEFFKVCEAVYPGVAIEHRPGPIPTEPMYVVTGMARRQVRALGGPTLSQSQPVTPQSSMTVFAAAAAEDDVKVEEKKPPATYVEKDVQAQVRSHDILPGRALRLRLIAEFQASAAYTNRTKPWPADESIDFKMWLRHTVLGLADGDCFRHYAGSPVDALKRFNMTTHFIKKVRSLGWETERAGIYRVPKDFAGAFITVVVISFCIAYVFPNAPEYRNAEFTTNSVREAVGVRRKLYEADYATFGEGTENSPMVRAWIDNPDDPGLLAVFNNMTREQFQALKASGKVNPGAVTPTKGVKQGKKRARESGVGSDSAVSKKHRGSDAHKLPEE